MRRLCNFHKLNLLFIMHRKTSPGCFQLVCFFPFLSRSITCSVHACRNGIVAMLSLCRWNVLLELKHCQQCSAKCMSVCIGECVCLCVLCMGKLERKKKTTTKNCFKRRTSINNRSLRFVMLAFVLLAHLVPSSPIASVVCIDFWLRS